MREFEFTIEEALKKGLRSNKKAVRNKQVLVDCYGFRIGSEGVEVPEVTNYPFPASLAMYYSWPFPQFLQGDKHKILVVRDTFNMEDVVYSIGNTYEDITRVFSIDELTFGKGGLMELADFGKYAFMTNGVIMLYWDPTINDWQEVTSHTNIPMMRTICNFKGQMIGGNVVSDWLGCDETYILWSNIGEANFTPGMRNEAGFRKEPFGGKVLHVRRLGDDVIVYSTNGITRMFPVQDPAPTFGFKEIHNIGIRNSGAVSGNVNEHLFVDKGGSVWKLDGGPKLTYLGYEEFTREFYEEGGEYYIDEYGDRSEASPEVIVSYDNLNSDFYICNNLLGFVKSPYGLSRLYKSMSSIWYDRRLLGTKHPDTIENLRHGIVSEVFNFGYAGGKTIFSIESGLNGATNSEVAIDWRTNIESDFQRTDWVPLNDSGIASLIIQGIEFRLCFRAEAMKSYSSNLDYFKVRWKMTDLRGLRGVYAAPPRGQE
jgi:hypothetical protein